jgi:rod shape-determining protein MreD
MNTYLSFAILFSLALVQSTVTPNVKLLGVQPDLMLMVVVSWSLLRGSEEGMLWALIGGIMIDMFSTVPFGASTLALLITSFLSGLGHRNIFRLALLVPALVIPVATLLYQLILYGLLYAFGSRTNLMITLSRIVFPSMLVNTLGMPIVYLTARLLHRRTKREEIAL